MIENQAADHQTFFTQIPQLLTSISRPMCSGKQREIRINPGANLDNDIFIREKLIISGVGMQNKVISIRSITVVKTHVLFNNINFRGLINIGENSSIEATNCMFSALNDNEQNYLIDIAKGGTGEFKNCIFNGGNKASIVCQFGSKVKFIDCKFYDAPISSVIVTNESTATFKNCHMTAAKKYSVFVSEKSNASFESCTFSSITGKGILIIKESIAKIESTKFENIEGGSITAAEKSIVKLEKCQMNMIKQIGISLLSDSNCFITESTFNTCTKSVCCNRSYIDISKSSFNKCALMFIGPYLAQHINDTKFRKSEITISDESQPFFTNSLLVNSVYVRVTDMSKPLFFNSNIKNLTVTNCSQVVLANSKVIDTINSPCGGKVITAEGEEFTIEEPNGVFKFSNNEYTAPTEPLKMPDNYSYECTLCQDAHPNHVFIPCGHLCQCQKCSENKVYKKCPICGVPGRATKAFFEDKCSVCLENTPDAVFLPCGHVCCCYQCAKKIIVGTKRCPICNMPCTIAKKLFPTAKN